MHLYGSEYIREIIKIQPVANGQSVSLQFNVGPSSFFQPNTTQAEIFYSKAIQLAQIPKDGVVYDLYCGTGTLGICAAQIAKQVVGIELFPDAALDARTNVTNNNLSNVTIMSGAVRYVLKQIQDEGLFPAPDVVMIDPPRPGLDPDAMKHLITLNPQRIVYLSCNPTTQARDVSELLQHGYRLEVIQPIDQFPQTYHIENIVILSR
jgi:23S rRNA (uracil1939-C5)-methyltransferase